jgi:hypothetical protein
MSSDLKYIMIDGCLPIVFGSYFQHKDIAEKLQNLGPVTSAGFISNNGDDFTAYGESFSLKMSSNPSDSKILTKVLTS